MLYDVSILCVLYGVEDMLNRTVSFKTFTAVTNMLKHLTFSFKKHMAHHHDLSWCAIAFFLVLCNLLFVCMDS